MPATIPPETYPLFDGPNYAHLATVMPDGTPQTTPVWVEREGDRVVLVNTVKGRVKDRNVRQNPAVALSILHPDDPLVYVQVRGRAEPVEEGAREQIDRLSHKYLGRDYPWMQPGMERLTLRVRVEKVQYRAPGHDSAASGGGQATGQS